jgi:hypothetical protein
LAKQADAVQIKKMLQQVWERQSSVERSTTPITENSLEVYRKATSQIVAFRVESRQFGDQSLNEGVGG